MDRVTLASRVVLSASYDSTRRTLELEFASGRTYRYEGVPRATYEWLLRTRSKGGFVARMINERYASRDVTPPPRGTPQDLCEALAASIRDVEREKPP